MLKIPFYKKIWEFGKLKFSFRINFNKFNFNNFIQKYNFSKIEFSKGKKIINKKLKEFKH